MTAVIDKFRSLIKNQSLSLFILTFLFHEIFVILFNSKIINVFYNLGDYLDYYNYALKISTLLQSGSYVWGAVYPYHWYPLFIGVLFKFFGSSVFLGPTINALLIAFSAVLLYKIISLFSEGINKKIVFWTVFVVMNGYLSLMFHSSLLLKESWIIFLILGILYLSIRFFNKERFNLWIFLTILVLFILLRNLRFFIGFAVIFGFFIGWFLESKFNLQKRIIYGLAMILAVSTATFFLLGEGIGKSLSVFEYTKPKFVQNIRTEYFKSGSTTTNINVVKITEETKSKNIKKDQSKNDYFVEKKYSFSLTGILESFFNVFLGPFPWQVSLKKYMLLFFDLAIWYAVIFFAGWGILKRKTKQSALYLSIVVVLLAGLTFGVDNFGALLRYRIPILILLSVFVPTGITEFLKFIKRFRKNENIIYNN